MLGNGFLNGARNITPKRLKKRKNLSERKCMKITKNLKYADFEWDDEAKTFTITEEDGNRVILNKVYAFAFMRFMIRMAQRNWWKQTKKSKKVLDNTEETVVSSDIEDLSTLQQEFSLETERSNIEANLNEEIIDIFNS